jgi:hypothetical protein
MPNPPLNQSSQPNLMATGATDNVELAQQLEKIKHSHSLRYQMLNLEIWALVGTMDEFIPGFWTRFMANRQLAFKEHLNQQKKQKS